MMLTRSLTRLVAFFAVAGFVLIGLPAQPAQAAWAQSPPTGMRALDRTGTTMQLAWNARSGANLYWVRYATNPAMTQNKTVVSSTSTSRQITGLQPNTTYYIQVRSAKGTAAKHTLLSEYSPAVAIKTDAYTMSPPSGFRVDYELNNSIGVSWNFVNNADSYRIQITGGGTTRTIRHQDTSTLRRISYEVTGLQSGVTYDFRVRALEQAVDPDTNDYYPLTNWGGTIKGTTTSVVPGETEVTERPPGAPTLTTISASSLGIEWEKFAGSQATGYRLQYWTSTDSTRRYLSEPGNAATSRYFNGTIPSDNHGNLAIKKNVTYYFRIAALKTGPNPHGVRISSYGVQSDFKPTYDREPPTNLRITGRTGDSVTVAWDPVVGATRYRVDWTTSSNPTGGCEENNNSCSLITPASMTAPSHTVTGLDSGKQYYFRVSAVATSTISDFQPIMVSTTTLADQPRVVKQVPNDPVSATAVTVEWQPGEVGSPTTYQLRYSTDAGMANSTSVNVGNVLKYRLNGLRAETNYMIQVRGRYANGSYTGWSVITSTHTRPLRGAISGVVSAAGGDAQSPGQTVVYAYDNANNVGGVARPAADGSFTIWDLPPGTWSLRYEYFGTKNVTSPWLATSGTVYYQSQARKITTNAATVTVPAVLPPMGVSVSGKVEGTRCVAGARVTALSDNTTIAGAKDAVLGDTRTASNGTYTINGLPKSEGLWIRFGSDCGTKSVQVRPAQTAANVTGVNTMFDGTGGGNTSIITGLSASNITDTNATISWTGHPEAIGYRIYWSNSASMPGTCEPRCRIHSGTATSKTLSQILSGNPSGGNATPTPGKTYYIKISAVGAGNKTITGWQTTPLSVKLTGSTPPTPTTVQSIRQSSVTGSSITVAWDAYPGAVKYRVYATPTSSMPNTCAPWCEVITPSSSTNPSHTLTGLTAGTSRWVKVSAINSAGKTISSWQTNGIKMTTSGTPAPETVQNVRRGSVTDSSITVAWDAYPGAVKYRVYATPTSDMPYYCEPWCTVVSPTSSTNPSFTLTGLTAGTSRWVKVSAINSAGKSISSWQTNGVEMKTSGTPSPDPDPGGTVPETVQGLKVANLSVADATVSWDPVPGAHSYRVYWSPTASMPGRCEPRCRIHGGTGTSKSLTEILSGNPSGGNATPTRGGVYHIKVSALNSSGKTMTGWQSQPLEVRLPTAVGQLSASNITTADALISWQSIPGAVAYRTYWSTSPSMPGTCEPRCQVHTGTANSKNLSQILSGNESGGNAAPSPGATYYVKVSAIGSNGKTMSSWQSTPLKVTLGN